MQYFDRQLEQILPQFVEFLANLPRLHLLFVRLVGRPTTPYFQRATDIVTCVNDQIAEKRVKSGKYRPLQGGNY
jgi:hypothetical protein